MVMAGGAPLTTHAGSGSGVVAVKMGVVVLALSRKPMIHGAGSGTLMVAVALGNEASER